MQDRDWYREEQRRKLKLYWNERTGEMEFDHEPSQRRWRWPYRLRPDLPYWVREWIRAGLFFGTLGLLYLAWRLIRGWTGYAGPRPTRFAVARVPSDNPTHSFALDAGGSRAQG